MEGVNMGGIWLGFLAVIMLGAAFLVALTLLVVGLRKAAKFVFAGGFLAATFIMSIAVLSFLEDVYRHDGSAAMIVGATGILLLAGAGQFIAAFRSPMVYAISLACALTGLAFGALATVTGTDTLLHLPLGLVLALTAIPAAASFVIAVLPRIGAKGTTSESVP